MTLTQLVTFLLVGLIAGWLAAKLMKGRRQSLVGYLVIGVIGALLGGFLFGLIGIAAYGLIGSIVMALVGAMILIALLRAFKV